MRKMGKTRGRQGVMAQGAAVEHPVESAAVRAHPESIGGAANTRYDVVGRAVRFIKTQADEGLRLRVHFVQPFFCTYP